MAFLKDIKTKLSSVREKWSDGVVSLFSGKINDDFWIDLEEKLISGDVGVDLSESLVSELKGIYRKEGIREPKVLLSSFRSLLVERLKKIPLMGAPVDLSSGSKVIVMVGVNGSGKTTTAGKLASSFQAKGKKVIMAAADTYRAAAVEQLQAWGERTGVRVIAQQQGSDPGAVTFDSINAAKASGAEVVIVDTAGRLQSKHNLMEELGKIYRVISREIERADIESFLVLDAVTGQNALRQAQVFDEVAPLTGIVLTKYDNTAKGGIVLAIADQLALPIRYIGLGEGVEDLGPFDPEEFVDALLGTSPKVQDVQ
nr:signal recognition particle-docking protein FtsY [uncultured Dethiosulfovibrio sp.]